MQYKAQSGELVEAVLQSEAKRPTFKAAKEALMRYLSKQGWTIKTGLKVPYATHPDGDLRLWFKKQAIYYSLGNMHSMKGAHSTHVDVRGMSPAEFVKDVEKSARTPVKSYF